MYATNTFCSHRPYRSFQILLSNESSWGPFYAAALNALHDYVRYNITNTYIISYYRAGHCETNNIIHYYYIRLENLLHIFVAVRTTVGRVLSSSNLNLTAVASRIRRHILLFKLTLCACTVHNFLANMFHRESIDRIYRSHRITLRRSRSKYSTLPLSVFN